MSYGASSNYFLTRLLYYKHKHDKKDKSFYGTTYLFCFTYSKEILPNSDTLQMLPTQDTELTVCLHFY